jgi:hypothetical protein
MPDHAGMIRVLRVTCILAVFLPHLQLPALIEKARERPHAESELMETSPPGSFKWIESPFENAYARKETVLTRGP